MDLSDLPGCIGLNKPYPPNNCVSCSYTNLCFRIREDEIIKELRSVLSELKKLRRSLKEER